MHSRLSTYAITMPAFYMAVMAFLPNRIYYPQLATLDATNLLHTLLRILVYGFIELLSLLILDWLMWRKMKFSPMAQLAFVLEAQWKSIQAKLILWVLYTVQSSLQHYGTAQFIAMGMQFVPLMCCNAYLIHRS